MFRSLGVSVTSTGQANEIKKGVFVFWSLVHVLLLRLDRRGGAEVAGWTLDRKIRVRFPAYPHWVWAL